MNINITTTGLSSSYILSDLGGLVINHPSNNMSLVGQFNYYELSVSSSFNSALDSGFLTASFNGILATSSNDITPSFNSYISSISNNSKIGTFGITIDAGTSFISTGIKKYISVPYNCIITGWTIIGNTTGNIVLDVWKSNTIPNVLNTITGSEKPTLISQQTNNDTNLTTWNTIVSVGDIIAINVDSVSGLNSISLFIKNIKL